VHNACLLRPHGGTTLSGLGVPPLDNPLGKANYATFRGLQRNVAAAAASSCPALRSRTEPSEVVP
jgi:hypothetical protein